MGALAALLHANSLPTNLAKAAKLDLHRLQDSQLSQNSQQVHAETRIRLLEAVAAEFTNSVRVDHLSLADIAACTTLPNDTLLAYIRAMRDSNLRESGKCPSDETAGAMCKHCGPVWIAPEIAAVAPVVSGWPCLLGCPWCHVKNRQAMPRPRVTCGSCKNFICDAINPHDGLGRCGIGCNPGRPWPNVELQCGFFVHGR